MGGLDFSPSDGEWGIGCFLVCSGMSRLQKEKTGSTCPLGVASLVGGIALDFGMVTWLILPVVICLSQRLSYAYLSINDSVL